jgi:hypothetical protein
MIDQNIQILKQIIAPAGLKQNILNLIEVEERDFPKIQGMKRLALVSAMALFLSLGLLGKIEKSSAGDLEYALISGHADYQTIVMSKN